LPFGFHGVQVLFPVVGGGGGGGGVQVGGKGTQAKLSVDIFSDSDLTIGHSYYTTMLCALKPNTHRIHCRKPQQSQSVNHAGLGHGFESAWDMDYPKSIKNTSFM